MAKQKSQFWQGTQDLAAGLGNIVDGLFVLPFFVIVVALPIWWGYGFISKHLIEAAVAAAGLLIVFSVWMVRRGARAKEAPRGTADSSHSGQG